MPLNSSYFTGIEVYDNLKISEYASDVLTNLCKWAEESHKVKREIKFTIREDSYNLNAGFNYEKNTVVINYALIQEIYRNCMLFPLYKSEMSDIDELESYVAYLRYQFRSRVLFHVEDGVPRIRRHYASDFSKEKTKEALEKYSEVLKEKPFLQESFEENNTLARFIMFELALTFLFFHEISHHFQSHDLIKSNFSADAIEEKNKQQQAREILADLQAMDLTFAYITRKNKVIDSGNAYFLHCGLNVLFLILHHNNNGLYSGRIHSLGNHPNPVLRAQFIRCAFIAIFINLQKDPTTDIVGHEILGLTVLALKALLCADIYWCLLLGKEEGDERSVFMEQSSDSHYNELHKEMVSLINYIELQHKFVMHSKKNIDYEMELLNQKVFDEFISQIRNPPNVF